MTICRQKLVFNWAKVSLHSSFERFRVKILSKYLQLGLVLLVIVLMDILEHNKIRQKQTKLACFTKTVKTQKISHFERIMALISWLGGMQS